MKKILSAFLFFFLISANCFSQNEPFVTIWDLSIEGGQEDRIQFRIHTTEVDVPYHWYQISDPSVQGSGTLRTGANNIGGPPGGQQIRLVIYPENLLRFSFGETMEESARLIRVVQWGNANWSSMEDAFLNCANLQVTATDAPDLSGVTSMRRMFAGCSSLIGPPNIAEWNISDISNMSSMFNNASSFNRSLSNWVFAEGVDLTGFLSGSGLDCVNYSETLIGWADNSDTPQNITIDCNGLEYGTNAEASRQELLYNDWEINGDTSRNENCLKTGDFVTVWDLSYPGSGQDQISFGTQTTDVVNYTWVQVDDPSVSGSGTFETSVLAIIDQLPAGETIRLMIEPNNLERFFIQENEDKNRLIRLEQWGSVSWTSMEDAFGGCENLEVIALDLPNLEMVTVAARMFAGCSNLTGPPNIGNWVVSEIADMESMLEGTSSFNQDIGAWNVSKVSNMRLTFRNALSFNQDIGAWDVSNATNMGYMFDGAASFNQNIGGWNFPNNLNLRGFLKDAVSFDQDLDGWDVSNVESFEFMFQNATSFNGNIGSWNTSKVSSMYEMFRDAQSFNQDISAWDVSNVENMSRLFRGSPFNQDISGWNVSNVEDMNTMFRNTPFNQNIGGWDVSSVSDMGGMFEYAFDFDHAIGTWQLHPDVLLENMLDFSGMSCVNYSQTLVDWAANPTTPIGRHLGAQGLEYNSDGEAARTVLGWTFDGDVFLQATLAHVEASGDINQVVCVDEAITDIEFVFGGIATGFQFSNLPVGFGWQPAGENGLVLSGSFAQVGDYTYTIQTISDCDVATITGTISVVQNASIVLHSGQPEQMVCLDNNMEEIQYRLENGATNPQVLGLPPGVDYEYDPEANTITISGTPTVTGVFPYSIEVSGNCGDASTGGTITVSDPPSVSLRSIPGSDNQTVCVNEPINQIEYLFYNAPESGVEILNLPPGITFNVVYDPDLQEGTISITGTPTLIWEEEYVVEVTGCATTNMGGLIIVDQSCVLSIPGGFSPNGDGINDFWIIRAIDRWPANNLRVFDRNGSLVFEETISDLGWDGRPNRGHIPAGTGDKLPAGVYFYQLTPDPGSQPLTGFVYISY